MAPVDQLSSTGKSLCVKCASPVSDRAPLGLCRQCLRTSAGLTASPLDLSAGLKDSTELADLSPNVSFDSGRFTLVEALGAGGMGVVWLALDERLSREGELVFVALKFLVAEIRENPQALDFLKREVLQSRRLNHPNILRIYDWHQHAGEPVFFSMEFLPGITLRQQIERREGRPLSWAELSPLLNQLCEALDYAHRLQKIVHRDLKPANVMVTPEGVLKLADFGLARPAAPDSQADLRTTHARGTPHYMSPQQLLGEQPRPADDIYAFGATLYELLTGVTPFEEERDIFAAIETLRPVSIAERLAQKGLVNDVPVRVRNVVASCLEKEVIKRPQSIREVCNLLGLGAGTFSPPIRVQLPAAERPQYVPREEAPATHSGRGIGKWIYFACFLLLVVGPIGSTWYLSGARSLADYQTWVANLSASFVNGADKPHAVTDTNQGVATGLQTPQGISSTQSPPADATTSRGHFREAALELVVKNTYPKGLLYVVSENATGQQVANGEFDASGRVVVPNLIPGLYYTIQAGHGGKRNGSSWVNYETTLTRGITNTLDLDFRPGDILLLTPSIPNLVIERKDFWNNPINFGLTPRVFTNGISYYSQDSRSEHPILAGRVFYTAYISHSYYQPQKITGVVEPGVISNVFLKPFTISPIPLAGKAWTNSLEMDLVWIDRGSGFWAARTDTTVAQYGNLIKTARPGEGIILAVTRLGFAKIPGSWKNPGFRQSQGSDYPVVGVSWEDATNFCEALTASERLLKHLGTNQHYALPSDERWTQLATSVIITNVYPWGDNFADYETSGDFATRLTADENWPVVWRPLPGKGLGSRTTPAGSFSRNVQGLYDVAGNVGQWCSDFYRANLNAGDVLKADPAYFGDDGGGHAYRVIRGSSWYDNNEMDVRTMTRHHAPPDERNDRTGFRVVLIDDSPK